ARHARDARLDQLVRPLRIADDLDRRAIEAPTIGVDDEVALQPVGKAEDDLAAGVDEAVGPLLRAHAMREEALQIDVVGEVIAAPVGAVAGLVPLKQAVVFRDAGAVEARAGDALFLNVEKHVDAELTFEVAVSQR